MMGEAYPLSDGTSPILPRKHWRPKATASGTRRQRDGDPGWITLWRGLEKLLLLRGSRLRRETCG